MDKKLLYSFFRCETGTAEEERIMDWLEAGPENRKEFEREREIFNSIVLHAPGVYEDRKDKPAGAKGKFRLGRFVMYAAGAAAMIAVAVGAGWLMKDGLRGEMTQQTMKISVPAGQRINITLGDGTQVWLNSETELEYPLLFGKERRVKINGEALFNVEHDQQKPFIVETYACDVEVLGTRFNVRAEEDKGHFSTALFTGKVKVSNRKVRNEYVILSPDDVVNLVSGHLRVTRISDPDGYLWPEGLISLGNMSFGELIDKFEKSYGVRIVIEREDVPQIRYMGKIRVSDGIDHALQILQRASDLDFTYEKDSDSNTIYIR